MTTKFPDVRIATEADRASILGLCRDLHDENGMFPLDEEQLVAVLDRALSPVAMSRDALIGCVGEPGNAKGCICLAVHALWYTRSPCIDELFNFVHPEHRQSNYATQMLDFAKAAADAWDLRLVIGVLSNERTEAKTRLYGRALRKWGEYYVYIPNDPEANKPRAKVEERPTSRLPWVVKNKLGSDEETISKAIDAMDRDHIRRLKRFLGIKTGGET